MWNPVILGKKGRRWTLTAVAGLTACALAAYLGMRAISSGRAGQVQVSWDETIGSMEDLLERYPPRGANDAALRLEKLSAAIGVDLATRSAEDRDRPAPQRADEFKRIRQSVGWYLRQQLEKPDQRIDPPPPGQEEFLERRSTELEALRAELRAGGGARPDSFAGMERSRSCPGERWIYRAGPDGSLSIELSRELSWGEVIGPVLPTRHTLPPPS